MSMLPLVKPRVELVSFGLKHRSLESLLDSATAKVVLSWDCRMYPNPHSSLTLKALDGRDSRIYDYVSEGSSFDEDVLALSRSIEATSCSVVVMAYCIGGRHRSVALMEAVGTALKTTCRIEHKELV